jgi:hypothetical protein
MAATTGQFVRAGPDTAQAPPFSGGSFFHMIGIFFHKFFNSAGGIDQFLLAGKKRMAGRTDFDRNLLVHRTEFHRIAAGAFGGNLVVFWVDILFHGSLPPEQM